MQDDIEQPGVESDFGGAEESSPEQAALEKLHAWADSPMAPFAFRVLQNSYSMVT